MQMLTNETNYNRMDSVTAVLYTMLMNVDSPEYDLDELFSRIVSGHFLTIGDDGVVYEFNYDGHDYLTWNKIREDNQNDTRTVAL